MALTSSFTMIQGAHYRLPCSFRNVPSKLLCSCAYTRLVMRSVEKPLAASVRYDFKPSRS